MNSIRSFFSHLGLRLGVQDVLESHLILPAYSPDRFVRCPRCNSRSAGVHSLCSRIIRDLPVGEYSIKIHLKVHMFYCRNHACATKIFSEQPGNEYVCRDRSSSYAAAVSDVIPAARQVADRFHLLRNLSDVVNEVIRSEPLITTPTPALKLPPEMPSDGSKEEIPERGKGECSQQRKELFSK